MGAGLRSDDLPRPTAGLDATALFVGAGRVTEMRDRQIKALVSALAMPVVLFFTLVVMLWGAGGHSSFP